MVGMLAWSIDPVHTFQQRFEISDYNQLFGSCRFYIVSRRPAVRLDMRRVKVCRNKLRLAFESKTLDGRAISLVREVPRSAMGRFDPPSVWHNLEIRSYSDGTYFSLTYGPSGTHLFHGDTWTLGALLAGPDLEWSLQEVLYVGQAFGRDGRRHVMERIREHKRIQEIYSRELISDYDVFLTPCEFGKTLFTNDDDLMDPQDELLDMDLLLEILGPTSSRTLGLAIDVVEHAMISYFDPTYNVKLRKWNASDPTAAMRRLQKAGVRTMAVMFGGNSPGLARFFSSSVGIARAHRAKFQLTPAPKRPRITATESTPNEGMELHEEVMKDLIHQRETEPPIARFFHSSLPKMVPSEV
jgi:hypothetical protein